MQDSRVKSESQIQQLQKRLEEHDLEKGNLQSALEKKIRDMEDMRSQNAALMQSALENEQRLLKLQSEHESLIVSCNRKEEANTELLSFLEKLKLQVAKEEKTWLEEKESILSALEVSQKESMDRKLEVERLSFDFEKQKIRNQELENQSKSCREQLSRLSLGLDKTNKELHIEKSESDKMKAEYTSKSFAFHAALESRESSVKQLEARVQDLELELSKKDEMINGCVLKMEHMEVELKDKQHKMEALEGMKKSLQAQLSETAEELQKSMECRIASEAKLVEYEDRFIPAKLELETEVHALKEICSSSKLKLEQALEQVQSLSSEKEVMIREISEKENEVIILKNQTDSLLYEKERLKESSEALLGKMKSQAAEIEEEKIAAKRLCKSLEAAEESLVSKSEETRQLGVKLEIAERSYCELREAKQKIASLEEKVAEVTLLLQEKEDNLSASEWAVEQVANEISKAKNALSQKEKEYGSLAKKLADAEFRLRAKEGEMLEMESCFQALVKKHSSKKAELEKAKLAILNYETRAMGWKRIEVELRDQIEALRSSVEEKTAELFCVQAELQGKSETQIMMEGAIQKLKAELAEEGKSSLQRQEEMERMCEELEALRRAGLLDAQELREAQARLQCFKHSSLEQEHKFQQALSELEEQLNLAHLKQSSYEKELNTMSADLQVYEEKCSCLRDALSLKDSSLADMKSALESLRFDFAQQLKSTDDHLLELNDVRKELCDKIEKERGLVELISSFKVELIDKELQRQELEQDIEKLQYQLKASSAELEVKNKEVSELSIKLEQVEILSCERDDKLKDLITKFTEELNDAAKSIKDRDDAISDMEGTLKECIAVRRNLEDVIETKEKEHSDALDRLNATEINVAKLQDLITKLTEELNDSAKSIKDRDDALSDMENSLKESLAVRRNLEDVIATKEKELSDALYRMHATEINVAKLQDSITKLTEELNDSAKSIKDRDDALLDMENSLKESLAVQRNLEDIIETKWKDHSDALYRMNATEIDVAKLQESITKLTEELNDSAKSIKDRDDAISEMENSLKESLAVQRNLEDIIETKGKELSNALYRLNATEIDVTKLQDSIAKLTEELNDSAKLIKGRDDTISDMENSLKESLALQRNLDDVIEEKAKEHRDALDQLNATKFDVAKLQDSIAKLTEELNDSAKMIKDRDDTISDMENSLKESHAMQRNLDDVIEAKVKDHRDALDQLNATEIDAAKLRATITKLIEEFNDLGKLIKDRDDAISDMESSLKESLAVQRTLEDVIETKGEELSNALDRLNATESNVAKLQGLITRLEDEMGRRNSELKAERDNVLALTQVSEDLEAERDMWKQTAASLDGTSDAIKAHLTEVLETVKELQAELKATKQEKESFKSTVHDLRSSLDDALCKLKAECNESDYLKKTLMELEGELSKWKQKHEEDSMALEMKGKELECMCQELQKATEQLESLQKAVDVKLEEEEEGKKKLQSATELASNLELEVKEWKEMAIAAKEELEVGSRVTLGLRAKLNAMEVERRDLDQLCLKLQNELALSQEEILERKEMWKKVSSQIEVSQEGETISHSRDLHQHDEDRGTEEHLRCLNEELEKALAELAAKNKEMEILKVQVNNEELYHYLELCDSLIRKEGMLERQLESLQRKNKRLQKQVDSVQRPDAKGSEKTSSSLILDGDNQEKQRSGGGINMNRKRIGETEASSTVSCLSGKFSCKGRLPLQMVQCQTPGSPAQVPIQKRRRSNNSEELENMHLGSNHSYRQL